MIITIILIIIIIILIILTIIFYNKKCDASENTPSKYFKDGDIILMGIVDITRKGIKDGLLSTCIDEDKCKKNVGNDYENEVFISDVKGIKDITKVTKDNLDNAAQWKIIFDKNDPKLILLQSVKTGKYLSLFGDCNMRKSEHHIVKLQELDNKNPRFKWEIVVLPIEHNEFKLAGFSNIIGLKNKFTCPGYSYFLTERTLGSSNSMGGENNNAVNIPISPEMNIRPEMNTVRLDPFPLKDNSFFIVKKL